MSDEAAAQTAADFSATEPAPLCASAPAPKRPRRSRNKDARQGELPIDTPDSDAGDAPLAENGDAKPADCAETAQPTDHGDAASDRRIRASIEVRGILAGDPLPALNADLVLLADSLADLAGNVPLPAETLPADPAVLEARLLRAGEARVAVIVDGDPTSDGPGRNLLAALGPQQVRLVAAPGALQRSLARVGLSSSQVEQMSIDHIGLDGLAARLRGGRLYAIEPGGTAPQSVGQQLESGGFHQSRVWLVEPDQSQDVHALLAFELSDSTASFAAGTAIIVSTIGDGSTREWPGIDAAGFEQALPEAARLLALAWLQPAADDVGWCIEPGEAALAFDWSHALPAASVHCIGSDEGTLEPARSEFHAGEGLRSAGGGAFRDLEQLPDPDAIFIRAGEEFTQQVRTGWERLLPGGRMVVAAEDEQSRQELMHFANRNAPLHWQDVSVSRGDRDGGRARLAPAQSVRMMGWRKPHRG